MNSTCLITDFSDIWPHGNMFFRFSLSIGNEPSLARNPVVCQDWHLLLPITKANNRFCNIAFTLGPMDKNTTEIYTAFTGNIFVNMFLSSINDSMRSRLGHRIFYPNVHESKYLAMPAVPVLQLAVPGFKNIIIKKIVV